MSVPGVSAVSSIGGGALGGGRSNGCGGGGAFFFFSGVPSEVANDEDACNVGRWGTGTWRFLDDPAPVSSSGSVSDSVMITECPGMFSDVLDAFGVSNGFSGSGVGGDETTSGLSNSSSGMASSPSRSRVESAWCVPTPPSDALRESRRKMSAKSDVALFAVLTPAVLAGADARAADSRAAFRR